MLQYGMARRTLLQAGLCLCGCLAAGRALGSAGLVEVAPGVLVRRGPDEEASPGNANGIANIGCIIGDDAVLAVVRLRVWPSPRVGRQLRHP